MTVAGRRAFGLWLAALLLVAAAFGLLDAGVPLPPGEEWEEGVSLDVPIVVIGTSASGFAVPWQGAADASLLGDGRAHARMSRSGASETQSLDDFEHAIRGGARFVLLEANTFVFGFAGELTAQKLDTRAGNWLRGKANDWTQYCALMKRKLKLLLRYRKDSTTDFWDQQIDRKAVLDPELLTRRYPLQFHEPRQLPRLQALLAEARRRGITVILTAPPRSETAARVMGPDAARELERRLHALAARLDCLLFAPGPVWEDRYFVDYGHVNRSGRERYIAELRAWWQDSTR